MGNEIEFYIDNTYENINDFDSEYEVFNAYLKKRIPDDKAAFHYVINSDNDDLIAYFSLLASCAILGDLKDYDFVPAVELKMFAIDKKYQGMRLGNRIVDAIVNIVDEITLEEIGARVLVLYSVPAEKVVQMYERSGFVKMPENFSMYKSYFTEGCIPMYKLIR